MTKIGLWLGASFFNLLPLGNRVWPPCCKEYWCNSGFSFPFLSLVIKSMIGKNVMFTVVCLLFLLLFFFSSFCHKPDHREMLCRRDREEETRSFGQETSENAERCKTVEQLSPSETSFYSNSNQLFIKMFFFLLESKKC